MMTRSSNLLSIVLIVVLISIIADSMAEDVKKTPVSSKPWLLSTNLDEAVMSRLNSWLYDVYAPEVKFQIRSRIARIDVKELRKRLIRSFDSRLKNNTCSGDPQPATADLVVNLFQDVEYRFAICAYEIGAVGHIHARGIIVGGLDGRSRVYFEIAPNMEVVASIRSKGGLFRIEETPEKGYFVLTEIDAKKAGANTHFD